MERTKIVVDASVAVKWFVEEEFSDLALKLRDMHVNGLVDLVAPSLMPYEVLNALKYSKAFTRDEMKIMAQAFDDLQIRIFDLSGDFAIKSIEIVMEKDITVYDASYVALAVTLNAIMYTADEKLLNRVKDFNCVKYIKELREALDAFPTQ